jgi:hypothetical protein
MSTLTVYPDPGDPGTTTIDGVTATSGRATWADAHDAADSDIIGTTNLSTVCVRSTLAGTYAIGRSFFLFDTSALGSGATVTAATLSLASEAASNTSADSTTVEIVSATPASNTSLSTADYDQIGSTSFASMTFGASGTWSGVDGAYNDFTLNASGLANISVTGISKFAARAGIDLSNTAATGINENRCYYADTAGNASDPKLVITYTPAVLDVPSQVIPAVMGLLNSGGFVGTKWV